MRLFDLLECFAEKFWKCGMSITGLKIFTKFYQKEAGEEHDEDINTIKRCKRIS